MYRQTEELTNKQTLVLTSDHRHRIEKEIYTQRQGGIHRHIGRVRKRATFVKKR